jgi:hypothetical protein
MNAADELEHSCPICKVSLRKLERYPRYVCSTCMRHAKSEDGQLLFFYNMSLSGGFSAKYVASGESYNLNYCWINGVKCYADEARFGCIVIQTVD